MNRIVTHYLLMAAAVYIAIRTYDKAHMEGLIGFLLLLILLFAIDMVLKPLLLLLSIPLSFLTLGAFVVLINTWLLMLADALVSSIYIGGFFPSLIITSMVTLIMEFYPEPSLLKLPHRIKA